MNTHANTIVAEIHESYSSAESQLLREARRILKQQESFSEEKASKLRKMGFGNSKPVVGISPEELERAQQIEFFIEKYTVIAPQYRFITDEKVDEINTKYGLVFAPAECFIGDIPEKNQEEIIGFQFAEQKRYKQLYNPYGHVVWTTADGRKMEVKKMSDQHLNNTYAFLARQYTDIPSSRQGMSYDELGNMEFWRDEKGYREDARTMSTREFTRIMQRRVRSPEPMIRGNTLWASVAMYVELLARGFDKNDILPVTSFVNIDMEDVFSLLKDQLYICADKAQLDLSKQTLMDNNRAVSKDVERKLKTQNREAERALLELNDPIVMSKVRGGWLIVTAWGAEASDEDVLNFGRN